MPEFSGRRASRARSVVSAAKTGSAARAARMRSPCGGISATAPPVVCRSPHRTSLRGAAIHITRAVAR
jgi:hypothetical protein